MGVADPDDGRIPPRTCVRCGGANLPLARTCGACGSTLIEKAPRPPSQERVSPILLASVGALALFVVILSGYTAIRLVGGSGSDSPSPSRALAVVGATARPTSSPTPPPLEVDPSPSTVESAMPTADGTEKPHATPKTHPEGDSESDCATHPEAHARVWLDPERI